MSGDVTGIELGTINANPRGRLIVEQQRVDHREENIKIIRHSLGRENRPLDWVLKRRPFQEPVIRKMMKVVGVDTTEALSKLCRINTAGQFTHLEENTLFGLVQARDMASKITGNEKKPAVARLAFALGVSGAYIEPQALEAAIQRLTDLIKASMPIHWGFGDGVAHIAKGATLGQRGKDDSGLVGQDALDVSSADTRYNFAPPVELFKPSTGTRDVRPVFETITYRDKRGIIVFDPASGWASDIMQPDVFATATEKTGGLLPLDMINARHPLREGNPMITAMVKDALQATITMLGAAKPAEGVSPADMSVLAGRRQALEGQLASLQ